MIETYEYSGLWWLPDNEETKRSGTLTITRGEAKLDVLGNFGRPVISQTETEIAYSPFPSDQPRILGMTANGAEVTLDHCMVGDSSMSLPGIGTTTYRPSVVFLGVWFTQDEEALFNEIRIQTTDLDTWVGVSGITQSITTGQTDEGLLTIDAVDIHFEPPESIPIALDDGDEAHIAFNARHSGMRPVTIEAKVEHEAALVLRYATTQGIERVLASVGALRNFLSLAIGRPVAVLSVTGLIDGFTINSETSTRRPIKILTPIPHNREPTTRALLPHDMLFTLSQATPSISDVLRAWFSLQEFLAPVLNLHFGMLYHPSMYSDVKFLVYAQAVETYDYRRRDVTDMLSADHEARVEAILTSSPAEFRDWLRTKLQSSNRLTLGRRIRDVLNECPLVRDRVVGPNARDRGRFRRAFVQSRNYYTHYNPDLEAEAATGIRLYLLTMQLRVIIEMSLLREIGFSCEAIDEMLERGRRYQLLDNIKRQVEDQRALEGVSDGS